MVFLCLILVCIGTLTQRLPWIASIVLTVVTEVILQLRIYALYQGDRKITILVSVLFAIALTPMIIVGSLIIDKQTGVLVSSISRGQSTLWITLCIPSDENNLFKGFWIPAIFNELFLFGLVFFKGLEERREVGRLHRSLTTFVVKGSMKYFAIVFATLLTSQGLWVFGGRRYIPLMTALTTPIASMICQRLLMELKEKYASSMSEKGLSSISFGNLEPQQQTSSEEDWVISFNE